MNWLKRVLGREQCEVNTREPDEPSFSPLTTQCLTRAGWQPGRVCNLVDVERQLQAAGFPLHAPARKFLAEFHGLELDVPIDGFPEIRGFVHLSPAAVLRFVNAGSHRSFLSRLIPGPACPIGTASGHTMYLFLNEQGRCYVVDMESTVFAELAASPRAALEVLCDGRHGRVDSQVLNENGRPSGMVLREGDEQRRWELEQYPDVAPFLPPVSLSPARRPPTWRPVVNTLQKLITEQGAPAGGMGKLLVTCGGFTFGENKQPYFVAHCENSIYVRQRSGVQVSGPPPGIPAGFRAGEILPFTPPAS